MKTKINVPISRKKLVSISQSVSEGFKELSKQASKLTEKLEGTVHYG
ncbi:MAG: hypothetical protein ACYSSI_02650 [Planctomycetota bacterium]|jgi:hypothetical protein